MTPSSVTASNQKPETVNLITVSESFEVRTSALRLEAQLQRGYSAGILEWRIE